MASQAKTLLLLLIFSALSACSTQPVQKPTPPAGTTPPPAPSETAPPPKAPSGPKTPAPKPAPTPVPTPAPIPAPPTMGEKPAPGAPILKPSPWSALPDWQRDDLTGALNAFRQSCAGLRSQPSWADVCGEAARLDASQTETVRRFFENRFTPYQLYNPDGSEEGMVTGYYEPLLKGSRIRTARYAYPLYAAPSDMVTIDLGSVYPELKNMRLRGRVEGNKVVPYYSRAEIENGQAPLKGKELVWVDDPIDLFFLQIQGSGRVQLENGDTVRVGYADQNGYPYKSIGKLLVERGELTLEKASMQGIKDWARQNPDKLADLLNSNPSYVFFRVLPPSDGGPLGALGVPLTPERSIAIDPRAVPLGAPVYLATTWPNSGKPLNRLVMAQDTGGAIKGGVRADFFWGFGNGAGALAGAMKQSGKMWVLLPNAVRPEAVASGARP